MSGQVQELTLNAAPRNFNLVLAQDEYAFISELAERDRIERGILRPSRAAVVRRLIRAAMVQNP